MADSNSTLFTTLRAVRCLSLYSWPCGLDARRATGHIFGALASLQGIKIACFYTAIRIFCLETRTPGYRRKKGENEECESTYEQNGVYICESDNCVGYISAIYTGRLCGLARIYCLRVGSSSGKHFLHEHPLATRDREHGEKSEDTLGAFPRVTAGTHAAR